MEGLPASRAKFSLMDKPQYRVVLLKAWTKDTLARKIQDTLEPYTQHEIVSIQSRVDFQFGWPWRRNWALLVLKSLEPV